MTHNQYDKNEAGSSNQEFEVYMVDETPESTSYPPERRGPDSESGTPAGQSHHHDGYTRSYAAPAGGASDMPAIKLLDAKVGRLETDVKHIRKHVDLILESLPSKNIDEHTEHHEDYALVLQARKEKEEEDKKLKKDLKDQLIKTVAQAVFMAVMVILGLGLQAQFSKWVNNAIEDKASTPQHTNPK